MDFFFPVAERRKVSNKGQLYISISLVTGVLLNWLGVAQAYIEPVRYLGVGLVIIGSFLIIAAMCRWMFMSPQPTTTTTVQEVRH